ncbi:3440_t:CDS:2, partial [Funneliformis mosseae]
MVKVNRLIPPITADSTLIGTLLQISNLLAKIDKGGIRAGLLKSTSEIAFHLGRSIVQFGFFHNLKSDFIMEVKKEYNKWIVLPAHILERMGVLVAESAPAWQNVRSTGNRRETTNKLIPAEGTQ